jgi:hypothetical protein
VAQSHWGILGIKPTTQSKAIRSAYAARLKTIDVDSDPAAFMVLRDAYEWAQDYARYGAVDDYDYDLNWDYEADTPLVEDQSQPLPNDDDETLPNPVFHYVDDANDRPAEQNEELPKAGNEIQNPWTDRSGEAIYDELLGIVNNDDKQGVPLSSQEYDRAETLTRQFIGWLDRATIDQARDYEFSMAYMMAYTIPRSDPMLETVPAYFGWDHTADQYDRPEQIGVVLERRDGNRAYALLMDPGHRLHNAFVELTSSVETKRRSTALRQDVRELLTSARQHHPSLLSAFNDDRVGEWHRTLKMVDTPVVSGDAHKYADDSKSGFNWAWAILPIVAFLRICSGGLADNPDQQSLLPEIHSQLDTSRMLNDIFGGQITMEKITDQNTELAALITTNKRVSENINRDQVTYTNGMRDLFAYRFEQVVRNAKPDALRQYWRIRADKAAYLLTKDASTCAAFVQVGKSADAFPKNISDAENKLMVDVLLRNNPEWKPSDSPKNMTVPGELVAKTVKYARLPEERVRQAMQGKGSDSDTCNVRIALYRTLADTKSEEAIKLMREI